MNGEEFRREVSNLLTEQVTLQKAGNEDLKLIREGMVGKEDHARVEAKIEKIWERIVIMGVIVSAIAATVGVVGRLG
jgi:hypothetical protein